MVQNGKAILTKVGCPQGSGTRVVVTYARHPTPIWVRVPASETYDIPAMNDGCKCQAAYWLILFVKTTRISPRVVASEAEQIIK